MGSTLSFKTKGLLRLLYVFCCSSYKIKGDFYIAGMKEKNKRGKA
jgi:hypothetical protein